MIPALIEGSKERIAELCRKYRIKELSIFGSMARGESSDSSDYDFLVDFMPDSEIDLFQFAEIQEDLSAAVNAEVDLVSKRGLKPAIRRQVLVDAKLIYAA